MTSYWGAWSLALLAIPAIALWLSVRMVYGTRPRMARDPLRAMLSIASVLMFVIAVVGPSIALLGPLALPLGVLGVIALLLIFDRSRRAEHRALLWSLAVAAQKGIPLDEAARAYADETAGDTGQRALRLAAAVEQGQPLSQAVRAARLRMAPAMRLAVGLGEKLGMLGPAMRQQLDDSQQADAALRDTIGRFTYLAGLLLVLTGILTFVMLKIVPVFERMFEEFEMELPAATRLVIDLSNFAVTYAWPVLLIIPFALTLIIVSFWIMTILGTLEQFRPNSPEEQNQRGRFALSLGIRLLLSLALLGVALVFFPVFWLILVAPLAFYYLGVVPRDLPLVWRLFRRYDGALVMRGLALAVRRGLPLNAALDAVGESYPIRHIAALLRRVNAQISAGEGWTQSLRRAKLISAADAAVLAAAERTGNLPWALEEMSDSVLRRQAYRLQFAMQLIFPPALLAVAAAVFLFAVGLFSPLVTMIRELA